MAAAWRCAGGVRAACGGARHRVLAPAIAPAGKRVGLVSCPTRPFDLRLFPCTLAAALLALASPKRASGRRRRAVRALACHMPSVPALPDPHTPPPVSAGPLPVAAAAASVGALGAAARWHTVMSATKFSRAPTALFRPPPCLECAGRFLGCATSGCRPGRKGGAPCSPSRGGAGAARGRPPLLQRERRRAAVVGRAQLH